MAWVPEASCGLTKAASPENFGVDSLQHIPPGVIIPVTSSGSKVIIGNPVGVKAFRTRLWLAKAIWSTSSHWGGHLFP